MNSSMKSVLSIALILGVVMVYMVATSLHPVKTALLFLAVCVPGLFFSYYGFEDRRETFERMNKERQAICKAALVAIEAIEKENAKRKV